MLPFTFNVRRYSTVTQMQKLLDAARDERNHERAQAQARDAEMARQLSDIREQALERIRESTGAAQEVAALKERLHGAEAERNRLRDENEELRADEDERRELRRRMNTAEEAAGRGCKKWCTTHSLRVFTPRLNRRRRNCGVTHVACTVSRHRW